VRSERAIPKPDFARIELKKLETSAEFDHILYTDISRFYGTIYTHTIPWALHGKAYSKANMYNASFKNSVGNQLDVLIRKGQDNQTIGIPIGPDTSRIASEIIAVAIEKRYSEIAQNDLSGAFRYVDDWFIGYNSVDDSERAISHLAQVCGEFELELNIEKTRIENSKSHVYSDWPEELSSLTVKSKTAAGQAKEIRRFFSTAIKLSEKNSNENVLTYALKMSRSFAVSDANFLLFESFVLRIARLDRITIPVVAQILIVHSKNGKILNKNRCEKYINDTINASFPLGHTSEVAWSLFLARELSIKLSTELIQPLVDSENSVYGLLCLDLEKRALVRGTLNHMVLDSLMNPASLWDANWLVAYEADLKGWLPNSVGTTHVENDIWFKEMKAKKISFYDTSLTVPTFEASAEIQKDRWKHRSHYISEFFGEKFSMYGGGIF
jgi:hypothetical protein